MPANFTVYKTSTIWIISTVLRRWATSVTTVNPYSTFQYNLKAILFWGVVLKRARYFHYKALK